MSADIHPENTFDNKQLEDWKKSNQQLLDAIFSGEVSEAPQNLIEDYLKQLAKISTEVPYTVDHFALCGTIALYFGALGWNYATEVPSGDTQSNYRFDVMAQSGERTIIVEVKPDIDIHYFGQIIAYIFHTKRIFNNVRVFFGTDITNFRYLLSGGEVTQVLVDLAKNHKLGIVFASQNQAWIVPAEFLLI